MTGFRRRPDPARMTGMQNIVELHWVLLMTLWCLAGPAAVGLWLRLKNWNPAGRNGQHHRRWVTVSAFGSWMASRPVDCACKVSRPETSRMRPKQY
jgi:hypothetical protein